MSNKPDNDELNELNLCRERLIGLLPSDLPDAEKIIKINFMAKMEMYALLDRTIAEFTQACKKDPNAYTSCKDFSFILIRVFTLFIMDASKSREAMIYEKACENMSTQELIKTFNEKAELHKTNVANNILALKEIFPNSWVKNEEA